jgi:hypothetical protein
MNYTQLTIYDYIKRPRDWLIKIETPETKQKRKERLRIRAELQEKPNANN